MHLLDAKTIEMNECFINRDSEWKFYNAYVSMVRFYLEISLKQILGV